MRTLLALLAFASTALAADIQIMWDPSTTTNVTYIVWIRSTTNALGSFTFANRRNGSIETPVGTNTTAIVQVTSATPSYVVVTAKGIALESDLSNQIVVATPPVEVVAPPSNLRIGQ